MLKYESIIEKIKLNMEQIKGFGVEKIGLVGSYIQNRQKADSDIDILVQFEKGRKTFDNYMSLKFFLENLFERKVDLVISEAVKPDLKPQILGSVKYAERV